MDEKTKSKIKNQINDLFKEKPVVTQVTKTKTICMVSNKGGTGKTNASICLTSMLAHQGYKVLYVDLDSQNNSRDMFDVTQHKGDNLIKIFQKVLNARFDLIKMTIKSPILHHSEFISEKRDELINFDILSLGEELDDINEMTIRGLDALCEDPSTKYPLVQHGFLKPIIQAITNKYAYDFIIIDTEPDPKSLLKKAALVESDYAIIIAECTSQGVVGANSAAKVVNKMQLINKNLKPLSVLITKYNIGAYCKQTDAAMEGVLYNFYELAQSLKVPFVHAYFSTMYNSSNIEGMQFSPLVRSMKFHKDSIYEDYKLITKTILGQIQLMEK